MMPGRTLEAGASCPHHPEAAGEEPCGGCGQPFCERCLVEIQGRRVCGECKGVMVRRLERPPDMAKEAEDALSLAGAGIIFFGLILEPIAFFKAYRLLELYREDPSLPGRDRAVRAAILSAVMTVLLYGGLLAWMAWVALQM